MDIINIPIVKEYLRTATQLYEHGWAERNGGNISMLMDEDFSALPVLRRIPFSFDAKDMKGRCIMITGSGKYLKNVERDPENNVALLRVCDGYAELLWGLADGGKPSSELAAHLLSHSARLNSDPNHRVVMHTHATNAVAMTFVHSLDEREFTRTLWSMATESIMFFYDGVAVLPWMPCGTDEIGIATAEKMKDRRVVVWAHHGVFGAGSSPDEALGLIETVDKAAEFYMMTAHLPILQKINDSQLKEMAAVLGIVPHPGYID
ncbi:MAG: rhamnulose-1-phosphate aldolase [Clostridiales bacterium]|nr:rhamnulose-1-phosphate aldolase [Clostridiales bacterium]